jgi:hypothetical protein
LQSLVKDLRNNLATSDNERGNLCWRKIEGHQRRIMF